ncbi:MAG TPA: MFS transporter [Woeseiaceae bacterium]|nr:MFS transporter [Woeseiaceae bacterium]
MTAKSRHWTWLPSLYFAEGLPFVAVMTVSVIMYKRLDISNTEIAFYTSWLYLPWVIKPLWSPVVDILKTRRFWIIAMQLLVGAGFAAIALCIPTDNFFRYSLAAFWLVAFSSATHDIAADGFYILSLNDHEQAWFVGIRNTFYRLAMISGQGLLVMVAGFLENETNDLQLSWSIAFYLLAAIFVMLFAWHRRVLPRPDTDIEGRAESLRTLLAKFVETFITFFRKEHIGKVIAFLLLYRVAEAQLTKLAPPFLLDDRAVGGLGLGTADVGFVYGTAGALMLTLGGLAGGFLAARNGLKYWLWWMVMAINLPDAVYVLLAYLQPPSLLPVVIAVGVEQFGYGLGFAAYTLYMLYVSRGAHSTAHFAICTGFMALGMMLPGMFSGWLQESLGYPHFFVWVLVATIPSFLVVAMIPLDAEFGRDKAAKA